MVRLQGRFAKHVHALLARGAAELERTFPGFTGEMVARGAQLVDVGRDMAWLTAPGWGVPFDSRMTLCCATRDLIEWQVRCRALQEPNVTLIDGAAVTGLLTDASGARVVGITIQGVGMIESVPSAAEIVRSVMEEAHVAMQAAVNRVGADAASPQAFPTRVR